MKIKIKFLIKSWAGLEKKFPPPQENELVMSKGNKLGEKDFGGFIGSGFIAIGPNFELVSISNDGIDFVTNGLVEYNPPNDKGIKTVNLRKESNRLQHHLLIGQTLALVTQSMDSGFEISITPLEFVTD